MESMFGNSIKLLVLALAGIVYRGQQETNSGVELFSDGPGAVSKDPGQLVLVAASKGPLDELLMTKRQQRVCSSDHLELPNQGCRGVTSHGRQSAHDLTFPFRTLQLLSVRLQI